MKTKQLTYKQFGEKAILIEWSRIINQEILQDILRFKNSVVSKKEVEDIIVGYNSLTLKYSSYILNFSLEVEELKQLYAKSHTKTKVKNYIWKIPVCYDVAFGIDLQELSKAKKLSVKQIVELHTQPIYTVYFIGFLPGFLYLGGLEHQLHIPRKSNPRLRVNEGAVAIGGSQTGIYPQQSAGGWHIIGQTPVRFFNIEHKVPCFAKSGDKLQFVAVSINEFQQMKKTNYFPKKELYSA